VLALALVTLGAWAYAASFSGVLVLDDIRAIARNETIRTLWPLSVPLSPPSASTVAGRPVANLSFALNYAAAPGDARDVFAPRPGAAPGAQDEAFLRNVWGYHLLNLVIHLAAGLVLFGTVRRTLLTERLATTFSRPAPWLAASVAAIWLLHPLQTEAVTYLVQRVESLMGLFYLLTLYCAIRAHEPGRHALWSAAAVASCALAVATKEVAVTAPVAVWLWDWTFGPRRAGRPSRAALYTGLSASWCVFGVLVYHEFRAPSLALEAATSWRYLLTQAAVITHYLRLTLWPGPLVLLYDWPLASSLSSVLAQVAFLAVLLCVALWALLRRHPLGFVGVFFFMVLAPTSSVVPIVTEVAAEHRMYLPLASVVVLAVAGAHALAAWLQQRRLVTSRALLQAAAIVTALAVASLGILTRQRNADYSSAVRLWSTAVRGQPSSTRARVAYAEALAAEGRLPEAETELRTAASLDASSPVTLVRLGTVQAAQGRLDEAIPTLERALAVRPDDVDAHRALARAYVVRRDDRRAVPHLERALGAAPDDPEMLVALATICVASDDPLLRDPSRAVELARRAAQLTSRRDPVALDILAGALAQTNHVADAVTTATEALGVARAQGQAELAAQIEMRLQRYRDYQQLLGR
jgi:tetratricopeptide (TPR) repeat protein